MAAHLFSTEESDVIIGCFLGGAKTQEESDLYSTYLKKELDESIEDVFSNNQMTSVLGLINNTKSTIDNERFNTYFHTARKITLEYVLAECEKICDNKQTEKILSLLRSFVSHPKDVDKAKDIFYWLGYSYLTNNVTQTECIKCIILEFFANDLREIQKTTLVDAL